MTKDDLIMVGVAMVAVVIVGLGIKSMWENITAIGFGVKYKEHTERVVRGMVKGECLR